MPQSSVNQSCSCTCGHSSFNVNGVAISRFFCHCQICQSIYKQPFADVTMFWAGAITLPENHSIEFNRYRLPPALRRGTCPKCKAPVVGFLRLAPFTQLAFVPSKNFAMPTKLPPPDAHIFYHRRLADAKDALPKISGYWASEMAITKIMASKLLHGTPKK